MRPLRRHFALIPVFVLSLMLAAPAAAQGDPDFFMDMAVHHGNNLSATLNTEIMLDAQRKTFERHGGGKGRAQVPKEAWPRHINERNVEQHVFTLHELRSMRRADLPRMQSMLHGRTITVQGQVRHVRKVRTTTVNSFNLIMPEESNYENAFTVFAHYTSRNPPSFLPAEGSTVQVRGEANAKLRNSISMRAPQILRGQNLQARRATASTAATTPTVDARATTAPNPDKLRFRSTPAVTREVNRRLTETLSASLAEGRKPEELRRVLDSGKLQQNFSSVIRPYGLSTQDLADVYTGYLVIAWQVVHDDGRQNPQAVAAVRKNLRNTLSRAAWVHALSDAQKQTLAEVAITGTMVAVDRYLTGKEKGDARLIAAAQADAHTMARAVSGIDLQRLQLTDEGFQRR